MQNTCCCCGCLYLKGRMFIDFLRIGLGQRAFLFSLSGSIFLAPNSPCRPKWVESLVHATNEWSSLNEPPLDGPRRGVTASRQHRKEKWSRKKCCTQQEKNSYGPFLAHEYSWQWQPPGSQIRPGLSFTHVFSWAIGKAAQSYRALAKFLCRHRAQFQIETIWIARWLDKTK